MLAQNQSTLGEAFTAILRMFAERWFERSSMMFWRENNNGASAAKTDESSHNSSFFPLPITVINLSSGNTLSTSRVSRETAESGTHPRSKPTGPKVPNFVHPQPSRPLLSKLTVGLHRSVPFNQHEILDATSTPAIPGNFYTTIYSCENADRQ